MFSKGGDWVPEIVEQLVEGADMAFVDVERSEESELRLMQS